MTAVQVLLPDGREHLIARQAAAGSGYLQP